MNKTMTPPLHSRRGLLVTLLSIALSVGGLLFLFSRLDLAAVGEALQTVDYGLFVVSTVMATLLQLMFPWRWWVLLNYRVSLWRSTTACLAGDFVNAVTPLRMGEVARAALIHRSEGVSWGAALSTIVLSQLLDLLALAFMGVLVLFIAPLPPELTQAGVVVGGLTLAAMLVLLVMALRADALQTWLMPLLTRLAGEQRGGRVLGLVRGALEGLQTLRNPLQLLYAVAISVALWLLIGLSGWVLLVGMLPAPGLELALAVSFAGGIGRLLPALPGSIGTLDFAVVFSLTTLGVPDDIAIASTLLLRLRYVLVTAITGVVGLLGEGVSLGRVRQMVSESRP